MPNLRTGTFARIIGMASNGVLAALEVPIKPITLPTGLDAAIAALGAATYGATLPSHMVYVGYQLVIAQDQGRTGSLRNGDATLRWQMAFNGGGAFPDFVGIPGRDDEDAALLLPGTPNKVNNSYAAWTAWV